MSSHPAHSVFYPARRTATYTTSPTDADGIKLSVATSLTAVTYSAATLDGVLGNPGPAVVAKLPMNVSIATTSDAATYNVTNPIVVTGTSGNGQVQTENIYLTATNGNETVVGLLGFATVVSVAFPAQLTTNGAFTVGVLDTVLSPPGRRIRGGATAGGVSLVFDDGTADVHPFVEGEHLDVWVSKVVWATTTSTTFTVYR